MASRRFLGDFQTVDAGVGPARPRPRQLLQLVRGLLMRVCGPVVEREDGCGLGRSSSGVSGREFIKAVGGRRRSLRAERGLGIMSRIRVPPPAACHSRPTPTHAFSQPWRHPSPALPTRPRAVKAARGGRTRARPYAWGAATRRLRFPKASALSVSIRKGETENVERNATSRWASRSTSASGVGNASTSISRAPRWSNRARGARHRPLHRRGKRPRLTDAQDIATAPPATRATRPVPPLGRRRRARAPDRA